jgi:hypothetical protein
MIFRTLLSTALGLALAWSVYWWVGADRTKQEINDWLQAQRSAGWVAEIGAVRVTGYPNRFDSVFEGLELADPAAGWRWQADDFNILALSYRPNHLILTFPGVHRFDTPEGGFAVQGEVLRASVEASGGGIVQQAILEGAGLRLETETGIVVVDAASAAVAETTSPEVQRLGLSLNGVTLDDALKSELDPSGLFPHVIEQLHFDATLVFETAPALPVVTDLPVINEVSLRNASLRWGDADIRAKGTLERGTNDFAEGAIEVRVRDWERLLAAAERSGDFQPQAIEALRLGLALVAGLSGDSGAIEATVAFRDGIARIGPFPLGPAPLMRFGD